MSTPDETLPVSPLALAALAYWEAGKLGRMAVEAGERRAVGLYAGRLAEQSQTSLPEIRDRALSRAATLVREGTTLMQAEIAAACTVTLPCDCEPA